VICCRDDDSPTLTLDTGRQPVDSCSIPCFCLVISQNITKDVGYLRTNISKSAFETENALTLSLPNTSYNVFSLQSFPCQTRHTTCLACNQFSAKHVVFSMQSACNVFSMQSVTCQTRHTMCLAFHAKHIIQCV
jgi:hypothetical protein